MEQTTNEKKWYWSWWAIILWIILSFILIFAVAFSFLVYNLFKEIKNTPQDGVSLAQYLQSQPEYEAEGVNNYWTGSANPKITIVEFTDFRCPNCASAYSKVREIGLNYKDDVKIIFRDYPVYENSIDLAMSARCAGEQGLFWAMHDKLFQLQGKFTITSANLTEIAKQIGADQIKFSSCLSSKKYLNLISKDYNDAEMLGVTGTPTFFINGRKIAGDIPRDIFLSLIEELLK